MDEHEGPWGRQAPPEPPAKPPASPGRSLNVWIWLGLIVAAVGGLWLLSQAFPAHLGSDEDKARLVLGVLILAIVSAGLARTPRGHWGRMAKYAAGWVAIFAVGLGIYAFRDSFEGVGERLRAEFSGSYPVAGRGEHELEVAESDGGGFLVTGKVNGQPVTFIVDTGSTDTVLSPADAQRLGIDTGTLNYGRQAETANGVGLSAPYTAERLEVGAIRIDDMPMEVNQTRLSASLLGMSFLQRLKSYQVRGHRLYLTW